MKKVVVGAAMLFSGVIGLEGRFIACALTVEPGGRMSLHVVALYSA